MPGRPAFTVGRRRLLAPAPSVAAVLVLLVGSGLPTAPASRADAPRPDAVRAVVVTPTEHALAVELPLASVTPVREQEPVPQEPAPQEPVPQELAPATARASQALLVSGSSSVPEVLLAAYRRAVAGAPPACHLPVSLLAAIGQVESGSLAGRSIDAAHRAVPPVLGPVLDGVSTAAIRDTDGGRLDGNSVWDRALGPMQFIPGTWAAFGVDADGDGLADPQDVFDAAAAAAGYLCARDRDLALTSGLQSAILAYNHSASYLATVLAWQLRLAVFGLTSGKASWVPARVAARVAATTPSSSPRPAQTMNPTTSPAISRITPVATGPTTGLAISPAQMPASGPTTTVPASGPTTTLPPSPEPSPSSPIAYPTQCPPTSVPALTDSASSTTAPTIAPTTPTTAPTTPTTAPTTPSPGPNPTTNQDPTSDIGATIERPTIVVPTDVTVGCVPILPTDPPAPPVSPALPGGPVAVLSLSPTS